MKWCLYAPYRITLCEVLYAQSFSCGVFNCNYNCSQSQVLSVQAIIALKVKFCQFKQMAQLRTERKKCIKVNQSLNLGWIDRKRDVQDCSFLNRWCEPYFRQVGECCKAVETKFFWQLNSLSAHSTMLCITLVILF